MSRGSLNDPGASAPIRTFLEFRQRLRIQLHRKFRLGVRALDAFLPVDGVAIDVGAHEGRFSLELSRRPLARVVACEPLPNNARIARRTLRGRSNCTVVEAAISDHEGTAAFSVPFASDGHEHTLIGFLGQTDATAPRARTVGLRTYKVPLKTLDSLVRELGLERVDLVKMDVEGHELGVLRGATLTLERFRPALCIEISRGMAKRSGSRPEEVLRLLAGAGYGTALFDLKNGIIRKATGDELLAALQREDDIIDVLATPAGREACGPSV